MKLVEIVLRSGLISPEMKGQISLQVKEIVLIFVF
jgi:hypothetical protein